MSALPEAVRIREVGPRDGFQNEPEVIPTDEKVRLIGMLGEAGLRRIELTSFVRADVVPQLADAGDVLERYERREGVAYSVLIPNERGLERALAHRDRFDEVNLFLSASETHNRKNVNRSVEDSLAGLEEVVPAARQYSIEVIFHLESSRLPKEPAPIAGTRGARPSTSGRVHPHVVEHHPAGGLGVGEGEPPEHQPEPG